MTYFCHNNSIVKIWNRESHILIMGSAGWSSFQAFPKQETKSWDNSTSTASSLTIHFLKPSLLKAHSPVEKQYCITRTGLASWLVCTRDKTASVLLCYVGVQIHFQLIAKGREGTSTRILFGPSESNESIFILQLEAKYLFPTWCQ